MPNERNALAELANVLAWYVDDGEIPDRIPIMLLPEAINKAHRIIAELAKVKLNGVGWPVRLELADAYENCRAIAEEGAKE